MMTKLYVNDEITLFDGTFKQDLKITVIRAREKVAIKLTRLADQH